MIHNSQQSGNKTEQRQPFVTPAIPLPKGGGATRGIGENFAANPVTGTGSLTVPMATSPSRSGFGPQWVLSYDFDTGNGPFGFSWNLSWPVIARKTDNPRFDSWSDREAGGAQFLDLAGDGQVELVELDRPVAGFYERATDQDWELLQVFRFSPNLAWNDPNLKFIDLTDIARIRNSEVCYWPNLGYGHFGAKVTMDDAPRFDVPDQFDPRCIRLADSDGPGVTDIIYFGRNQTRHPAFPGERINIFYVHNLDRVLAFQRWLEGSNQDVVVVMSFNESTFTHYDLGFPRVGHR